MADALVFRNLRKSFGGARALDGVHLRVGRQQVHGLLGQNGSGKSTLIKILAGYHAPDPGGELELFGHPVPLPLLPGQFKKLGIAFVHQHLGLIPSLSVLENLRIGAFAAGTRLRIDWRAEHAQAKQLFARFGLYLDPSALVATLAPVERALLAIIRAFDDLQTETTGGSGILVLDEPTPFLPKPDVDRLFSLVADIVRNGCSVILVSHDIEEVLAITDQVTVLRNGQVAGSVATAASTRADLLDLIVGRRVDAYRMMRAPPDAAPALRIANLAGPSVAGFSCDLPPGEVVGLTGLIGSGYAAVPYMLFGDLPASGQLLVDGHAHDLARLRPASAQALGIALLPGDRLGAAGIGNLPITDNITLPVLSRFLGRAGLDRRGMAQSAHALGVQHDVRPNRPALPLEALSGGNQQKVLLAKWLQTAPRLLLLDEPTQGVDFGARQQIFAALDAAAAAGTAILCASTDFEQLAQICHRVLVFRHGQVVAEFRGDALTKDAVARACYQAPGIAALPLHEVA